MLHYYISMRDLTSDYPAHQGRKNSTTVLTMWQVRCPYCPGTQGRCALAPGGRSLTECCSCGRVVDERHTVTHPLFHLRAVDSPLLLVTPDLNLNLNLPSSTVPPADSDDPFHPTGFITAFSTWSLERVPLYARSTTSFSGHLAELERLLDSSSSSSSSSSSCTDSSGPMVSMDNLRAYLQIVDVASILRLDQDIADHAFELFKDCSSTTCLRNRSVEALATAALVQAIREAQEPRTLQEISTASNLPQKEIGKYIKILGEALKLSQPLNSNSIAVHMPRFCNLLQLNKSAQELAAHIGEVVVNKCFCTRRNPISISAAAIYLACQLEDKRKTQAEICKVTGLTEVTLRKVYKELLENWDDLLPANYTPATPPEKAFPMTAAFYSGRASVVKSDATESQFGSGNDQGFDLNKSDRTEKDVKMGNNERWMNQLKENSTSVSGSGLAAGAGGGVGLGSGPASGKKLPNPWQFKVQSGVSGSSSYNRIGDQQLGLDFVAALKGIGRKSSSDDADESGRK